MGYICRIFTGYLKFGKFNKNNFLGLNFHVSVMKNIECIITLYAVEEQ